MRRATVSLHACPACKGTGNLDLGPCFCDGGRIFCLGCEECSGWEHEADAANDDIESADPWGFMDEGGVA